MTPVLRGGLKSLLLTVDNAPRYLTHPSYFEWQCRRCLTVWKRKAQCPNCD